MADFDYQLAGGLVAACFLSAIAALGVLSALESRWRRRAPALLNQGKEQIAFLFEDEILVNATPEARKLLSAAPAEGSDWTRLASLLLPRFPGLTDDIAELADRGELRLTSTDGCAVIEAEWRAGLARLRLLDVEEEMPVGHVDRHSLRAMEQELGTLRMMADSMQFLVWREHDDGPVTWANTAYLDLADQMETDRPESSWPPRKLFVMPRTPDGEAAQRVSLTLPGEEAPRWFDCTAARIGSETLFTAVSADREVRARRELQEFMQTLTKTFSHLTIGLAVFDRKRQLALFNPALTDLTALPVDFMSKRPTLFSFLDRLREKQMMPEPKDYKSWRQQMVELEAAAADGTYAETWALATGQTYRVTGRPHPDGAVALLFEDISAEMSLTRRFRAELETSQAVLDAVDEAIAVFSPAGVLTLSNAAYERLWRRSGEETLTDTGIVEATRHWHALCAPTPIWGDVRDFVGALGERAEWTAEARLADGRRLTCRFVPLPGGATLAGFTPITTAAPLRHDPAADDAVATA